MPSVRAFFLLATVLCVSARLFPPPGYINPWEVEYNLDFGSGDDIDISKMFLLPSPDELQKETEADKNEKKKKEEEHTVNIEDKMALERAYDELRDKAMFLNFDEDLQMEKEILDEFPHHADVVEKVQNISHLIKNFRRRLQRDDYWAGCPGYCNKGWYDSKFDKKWDTFDKEQQKRIMLTDLILAYLIHMRYKVKEAMNVRHLVKNDKRYMMGYMFNRLRRLMYDIRKIYQANAFTEASVWMREVTKTVKVHRTFIALSVDIRDTVAHIKHMYLTMLEPNFFEVPTKKPVG